jgi:hypothetical protein
MLGRYVFYGAKSAKGGQQWFQFRIIWVTEWTLQRSRIEAAVAQNNKNKFEQSFHTPVLQTALRQIFGFKGLTAASHLALNGAYTPPYTLGSNIEDLLQ